MSSRKKKECKDKNVPDAPKHQKMLPTRERETPGEIKVYGLHACLALARNRIHDVIRVYCSDQRIKDLSSLLHWCAKNRRAYHVISAAELNQVSGSMHHEGVCILAREKSQPSFDQCLRSLKTCKQKTMLLYLGGITNPFNLGAIVRVAAHFGVYAILIDSESELTISGAVYRVAEGGIEHVPIVRLPIPHQDLKEIKKAGFQLIATTPKAKLSVFKVKLGVKVVFMLGSEATGLSKAILDIADKTVTIPGTGFIESLNLSAAASIVAAQFAGSRG